MDKDLLDVALSGLKEIWNVQLTKADEIFEPHIKDNVSFCCLYAQSAWTKAVITEDPIDCKEAFSRIESTIKMAKAWKKTSFWKGKPEKIAIEGILWAKIATAEIALFDAMLKFKTQKRIKGAFNFRKSWKSYEGCVSYLKKLDKDSDMYEILTGSVDFGVGLFHYMISIIPKTFLWLVEGIGFKADRMLALKELESACNSGGLRATTAKLLLIALHSFFFGNEEAAMEVFQDVMVDFPDSPIFKYFGGYLYRKQGELKEARTLFTDANENSEEIPQFQLFTQYELGYIHFLELEWPTAIEYFSNFLAETISDGFRAFCNYQLGVCYAMQFQYEKALDSMKESLKWTRKGYAYDEYVKRHAKMFLSKGEYSDFERKFTQAILRHEARDFKKALKYLRHAEPLAETENNNVVVLYFRGDCYKEKKQTEKAKENFEKVIAVKKEIGHDYIFAVASSYVCLAELALLEREYEEARQYYKEAGKFSNFDFDSWCQVRIRRGMDVIRMVKSKENEGK